MYPLATNFDASATREDGSCVFTGCTNETAVNFQHYANVEDGSCDFEFVATCPADINGDGAVAASDLLVFLGSCGQTCE